MSQTEKQRKSALKMQKWRHANPQKRRAAEQRWADANPEKYKEKNRRHNLKGRSIRYERVNALKDGPCFDCGRTFDPVAMDFDHKYEKIENVAQMVAGLAPFEKIEAEIKKCDLVCANCHRSRTLSRMGGPKVYRKSQLAGTIDAIKKGPCKDCGKTFSTECMSFDHRDPSTKSFGIGTMRTQFTPKLQILLEEIAKCDLVCECCHRIRTHGAKKCRF